MHAKEIDKSYELQLIKIVLLLGIVTGSHGRLTQTPSDSIVLKGKTNVFTCCSNEQGTIFWQHKPVGSEDANGIYDSKGLINGFLASGRFSVGLTPGSRPGCHSLITTNVSRGDEGTYSCADKEGLGQWKGWELVMLESFHCRETNRKAEYMGVNDFGLPQDVISAVCFSKYFGNVRPKIVCEWSSGTQLRDNYHHETETNLTTTLNIQIPARKELNGDQLSCYAKIEDESGKNQNSTVWQFTQFSINYALFQQKGVSQCNDDELSLHCKPPCTSKMGKFINGSLYCEIAYPVQPARTFNVSLKENTDLQDLQSSQSGNYWIIWTIVAGFSGICIGGLTGALVVYCHMKAPCLVQHTGTMETGECTKISCCAATLHQEAIEGEGCSTVTYNPASDKSSLNVQQNIDHRESKKNNLAVDPLLGGKENSSKQA